MTTDPVLTVLLIEDDIIDIKHLQITLKENNIKNELIVANNGIEALNKLYGRSNEAKINPHVVILDVSMPKMGGLEFLKILRTDAQFSDLPVCVLSSSTAERDLKTARKLGVRGYLFKPLDFEDFLPVYTRILEEI